MREMNINKSNVVELFYNVVFLGQENNLKT